MSRGHFMRCRDRKIDLRGATILGVIATVAIFATTTAWANRRIALPMPSPTVYARHTINMGDWAFLPPQFTELTGPARPAAPELEKLHCYDTEYGWIFASNSEEARKLAEDVRAAAVTFQRCFGKQPGRGAVVIIGNLQSLSGDGLRKAGAQWIQPWLDKSQFAAQLDTSSIRAQVRQQLNSQLGSPATEAQIDQVMKQLRSQMQSGATSGGMEQMHMLRHELGHIWFIRYIYGIDVTRAAHGSPHYGGPAPDWLDETAAVLMEDDTLTAMRRRDFQSVLQGSNPHGAVIPLVKLFTMTHPSLGQAPQTTDAKMHITMRIGGSDAAQAEVFYEECRSLIDFLSARTHNPHLWLEIAKADKRHLSTTAWLAQNGPRFGLPSTVAELEKQWLAWAKQQTG